MKASIKPSASNQLPMNDGESIWAYDRHDITSDIQPNECRQYVPPIDEPTADRLSLDRRTAEIMDALELKTLSDAELDAMFPGSEDLADAMRNAGIIRHDCNGWTLAEPYYWRCRSEDVYWFFVSGKREWGLAFGELCRSIAAWLVSEKFGMMPDEEICGKEMARLCDECPDKVEKAADAIFAAVASLLSDEEPSELLARWTAEERYRPDGHDNHRWDR